jgi:glycosyltransferase involved in cell wall biosynthesis
VTPGPRASVIVPARNEGPSLRVLIPRLLSSFPRDEVEIIVVDNGSSDDTATIIAGLPVRNAFEDVPSSYRARNRGIRLAAGEWLAFLDADCIPEERWLPALLEEAEASGATIVAGAIEHRNLTDTMANRVLAHRNRVEVRRRDVEQYYAVPAGNMLVHRSAFERHGMFDEVRSGADIAFSKKVAASGEKIAFAENARVTHLNDFSTFTYLARCARIAFGQQETSGAPATLARVLRMSSRIPWRPGFGAVASIAGHVGARRASERASLWAFLWLERLAAYAGGTAAVLLKSLRVSSHPPPMAGGKR